MFLSAAERIAHLVDFVIDGRYELIEKLGSGTYGVIYHAIDLQTGCHVAVKVMRIAGRPEAQADLLREETYYHALMSEHPNVLTLHDAFEDDDYLYLVLDLCRGGDLYAQIQHHKAYAGNDALLRAVLVQIIDAVQACHESGIFHRDLKPENILASADGAEVFLCDFGLATDRETGRHHNVGTPTYMSPECIGAATAKAPYSNRANDVWALGVILVNMIARAHPWAQAVEKESAYARFVREPRFLRRLLPNASRRAEALLYRIFELDPARRITLPDLREAVLGVDTFFRPAKAPRPAPPVAPPAAVDVKIVVEAVAGDLDDRTPRPACGPWVAKPPAIATSDSEYSEASTAGPVTPEASVMKPAVLLPHEDNEIADVAREPAKQSAWSPFAWFFATPA